ncbi:hypothetical protein DL96DRAFT_1610258 [Flagelloscypha sp. PMI_526]|nr:hypothetical protein DL96DRAFT_1610258 [Flagelloscypha sp. PMI_526]
MLPQDLIRPIVLCFRPERPDDAAVLHACCLVTSTFRHEAQPRLFSVLKMMNFISNKGQLPARFRKLLKSSPHIASWVTLVQMSASFTEAETEVLESLTSLRVLWYHDLGQSWSKMPSSTRKVLQSKVLPRLKCLAVDFLVPGLQPWNYIPSLRLNEKQWSWTQSLSANDKLKLDYLELTGTASDHFDLEFQDRFNLWKFLELSKIKSITCNSFSTTQDNVRSRACYRNMLHGARMNLTSLTWGPDIFTRNSWDDFKQNFDFLQVEFLPVLENLTVEFSEWSREDREPCIEWLSINHFKVVNTHPLKCLTLTFKEDDFIWRPDWEHSAWTELDAVLCQDGLFQFQSLRLEVMIPLTNEFRSSVAEALPMSWSRRLVQVQTLAGWQNWIPHSWS